MPRSKAVLHRETIVREALALLNETGVEGVTTRKLAGRLGVKSASLYWHFKDKRDLLDAMAAAMTGDADDDPPHGDWRAWLARQAHAFRSTLLAYRDGARVHGGTRPSQRDYPAQEQELGFLCAAGFSPEDALRARVAVSYFVVGWVLEEQAAADAFRARGEKTPRPDVSSFPLLAAAQSVLRQENPDTDFDFGLQALLTGFAARLTAARRTAG